MPADAQKVSLKEVRRLKKMPHQMPEHAMLRYSVEYVITCHYSV